MSISRNNPGELNRIVSSVLLIKLLHLLLSASLLIVASLFVPYVYENAGLLFFCCFLLCFTDILFPVWFYQGIEKMKYLALIKFISILFYTVSIFILSGGQMIIYMFLLLQSFR